MCLSDVCTSEILFVDQSLTSDCTVYNYTTRQCFGGIYKAYTSLTSAADVAIPGDTVVIRGGTYNEQLAPKHSGTVSAPILYSNFTAESVVITGSTLSPAIWLFQCSYITIQGVKVANVQRWLAALGSHHLIIRTNSFSNANDPGGSSKTGLFFQESDNNIIQNNVIDNSTQDNLAFIHSNRNLIEGNSISNAAHTLWTFKCSSRNILRRNYFRNKLQKIGEIYDCENVGYGDAGYAKITILDSTKYNVVEDNIFDYTASPVNASPYAGIQLAAQNTIIRRNLFYSCLGPGIDLALYSDEARNNYKNTIYNNVFFSNEFGGMSISGLQGNGYSFHGNIVCNNIFYRNKFSQYDKRWQWYDILNNKPVQIITGRTSDILFARNCIFNSANDELWTIAYGDRTSAANPAPQSLKWWETNHPSLFLATIEANPLFVDTASRNFHLLPASAMIDAGAFMAVTMSESNGDNTTLSADNVSFFSNGFGITGGDTIQLQGSTETAVITDIDYKQNKITLNKPLNWQKGQGVALKFNGKSPDIGAFETLSVSGTEVKDTEAEEFALYPNPAADILSIDCTSGICSKDCTVKYHLTTVSGRHILTVESNKPHTIIPLVTIANGVYRIIAEYGAHRSAMMLMVIR